MPLLHLLLACAATAPRPPAPPAEGPVAPAGDAEPAAPAADLVYFVFVDRFADGAPDALPTDPDDPHGWHGGDLRGVLDNLDHLDGLGVRTLWLSPIFEARDEKFFEWGAFHGYWVEDIGALDPRFGTLEDLAALRAAMDARGMRLVLDVVWNHVAMEAPLVAERPDWFHPARPIEDWDDPHQLVNHEVHGLPDLAQENTEVYAHLLENTLRWLPYADGLRIDAVRHMPSAFLAQMAEDLKRAEPDLWLLGEIFDGDPVGLARDFEAGAFDAVFDFPLRYAMIDVFCGGRSAGRLASVLAADRLYNDPDGLVTFLDNHDVSRVWSECGEDEAAVGRALDFQLTARGIPALTYGTEAGLGGMEEPANRADMDFSREIFDDRIRSLMDTRSARPSLQSGETRLLQIEDDLLVYARAVSQEQGGPETAWIAVNLGEDEREIAHGPGWTAPAGEVSWRFTADPAPPAPEGTRRVQLRASGAPGPLAVVGSGPELGNWSADAALPMRPDGDGWVLEVDYPAGAVLEFKLIARDGDAVQWDDGENRFLLASGEPDAPIAAELVWGERR